MLRPDSLAGVTPPAWSPPPALQWLQALRTPALALGWSLADWQRVIRLSRRLRLLARLAEQLQAADLLDQVPAQVRPHLISEQRLSRWRLVSMEWAIERVGLALSPGGYPLVLLKGAAYVGQDLAIARGRLPSDLDILVPRECIADAQVALRADGWVSIKLDAHDQRYYDEWSHEVPPMRHAALGVELDLHHNILPPVARTCPPAGKLLDCLQASSKWPTWQVLSPIDQILHSAAHLFHDSEVRDRLRDLIDLDGLLRPFADRVGFWDRLHGRAVDLGLTESLSLAFHFLRQWIGTSIPMANAHIVEASGLSASQSLWLLPVLRALLMPVEPDSSGQGVKSVAAVLFSARYHCGRLPIRLLLPHLFYKLKTQQRN